MVLEIRRPSCLGPPPGRRRRRECEHAALRADPASAELLGGSELRPLAAAEDLGRRLVNSFDAEDLRRAVISPVAPFDLVGANRSRLIGGELPLPLAEVWRGRFDGELGDLVEAIQKRAEANLQLTAAHFEAVRFTVDPKGIPAAALGAAQRELLRDLMGVYAARLPHELAEAEMGKYAGERIDPLHFAWAGGIERGVPHYYRVQGSRLLIEYDNTQRDANHAHSVWRDPEGDFGVDVLGEHHRHDGGSSGKSDLKIG